MQDLRRARTSGTSEADIRTFGPPGFPVHCQSCPKTTFTLHIRTLSGDVAVKMGGPWGGRGDHHRDRLLGVAGPGNVAGWHQNLQHLPQLDDQAG